MISSLQGKAAGAHKSMIAIRCKSLFLLFNYSNLGWGPRRLLEMLRTALAECPAVRVVLTHGAGGPGWHGCRKRAFFTSNGRAARAPSEKAQETEMQYVDAHGARIPQIGIGTMTLTGEAGVAAMKTALDVGYRHLDTANHYGNEKENGEALRASGVKRADVFITTKVRPTDAMPDDFARVVDQSLANLQLPFVDLL
jgi:hypothetical protein